MKYTIIIIFAAFLLACNNKPKPVTVIPVITDTVPHADDFGLKPTDFNITQREYVFADRGRKVKDPPLPPPPPGPVLPSPPGVILLDFDGYTVTGTNWNTVPEIVCTPSGLSVDEQQRILDTVAYRYRMFNVIVTTADSIYNKAPVNKRTRCIITEHYTWYGQAGGVSFIGSFTWGNTPCFVFSLLLNYNTKMIYEAVCHEIGHAIGLNHIANYDAACVLTSQYNYGDANFAPIMGVAYYSARAGWVRGPTPFGCNSIQDDTLVIKSVLK